MPHAPAILCPVDFSDPSRSALRYAVAIADHFGARLTVLSVDDPLLASVADGSGAVPSLADETRQELRRLVGDVLVQSPQHASELDVRVEVGKPEVEILRVARETAAELIVMSSHGRSGLSKRFFGSTTERVLRAAETPVLVTPSDATRIGTLHDIARRVHHVLAPVDLSAASAHQVTIAAGIAVGLGVPLLLAHVLEPLFIPPSVRRAIPGSDAERRADAEARLRELAAAHAAESLVLMGDPSDEIVKLSEARDAGLT
jgi:nucleotide-binding universal stress UspA family protein